MQALIFFHDVFNYVKDVADIFPVDIFTILPIGIFIMSRKNQYYC